jgi:MFS family permease
MPARAAAESITYNSKAGRRVLGVAIAGSGMAFLDSTIVSVALPAIGRDFDASTASLQWILNGYLLTLASLILLGGSLGDRYGRRRVFVVGTGLFAAASLLCAIAPGVVGLGVTLVASPVTATALAAVDPSHAERRGEPPVAVSTDYSCSLAAPPWRPRDDGTQAAGTGASTVSRRVAARHGAASR